MIPRHIGQRPALAFDLVRIGLVIIILRLSNSYVMINIFNIDHEPPMTAPGLCSKKTTIDN